MSEKNNLFRLVEIAGAKKYHLIISSILALLSSGFALAPYIMIYFLISKLFASGFYNIDLNYVVNVSLYTFAALVLRYLLLFVSIMFSHVAAFDILYRLRSKVAAHLGNLPMGYFSANGNGKIKKIMYEDVEEMELFIAHHIPDIVTGVCFPILVVIYLFTIDWKMALVSLIPIPIAFVMQQKAFDNDNMDDRRKRYHDSLENMNSTIVEYIRGMPVVKIFNQTVESFSRLKEAAYSYTKFVSEITRKQTPPWAAFVTITTSTLFFILPFGLFFYMNDMITLPTFLLFLMVGSGYMTSLIKLAMLGGQLGNILEGLNRIDEILNTKEIKTSGKNITPTNFSIEFRDVSFGYGDKKVLKNTNFIMDENRLHALVGPSGAGKSTIAQLLLRMWNIDSGKILIGGVNLEDIKKETLMDMVGYVFQDPFIFSDTIYENIRMGMDNVRYEDIENAAKTAQIYDFINDLPHRFDTKIGEGGDVHLSGGEKQRISLARVVVKNPPILILDEATAYADAENESKIQAAFSKLMKNKTTIVIAHRLSTITDADNIYVIEKGGVAESGTHEKLLENELLYKNMWIAHTRAVNWKLSLEGVANV